MCPILDAIACPAHELLVHRQAAFGVHVSVAPRAQFLVFDSLRINRLIAHGAHLFTLQLRLDGRSHADLAQPREQLVPLALWQLLKHYRLGITHVVASAVVAAGTVCCIPTLGKRELRGLAPL